MVHTPQTHPGGKWVAAENVPAQANAVGRTARFADGFETAAWEWVSPYEHGPITHWYFAPEKGAVEVTNTCEHCKHWKGETDLPPNWRASTYWAECGHDDYGSNTPPHANLDWGTCSRVCEGFNEEIDWSGEQIAVWDGSEYKATLLTRRDWSCQLFRTKEPS